MKKVAILAAIAALSLGGAAWAQAPKPAAKEAAKPAAKEPAKKTASSSKRQEDARHCLEKGNNTDIIKCAEAYL